MLLFFPFFSVLNKLSNFSSPHLLLFPQMHTNTSTQRYTCSKKKKKTLKYTNTPTHKQTQMDKQQRDRSVLIGTIGACGSELGRSWSDLIWSDLIDACGSELGRSVFVDRCLLESCLIGAMDRCLWPRGRIDLCSEMGIEMGIEREQQIKKNG